MVIIAETLRISTISLTALCAHVIISLHLILIGKEMRQPASSKAPWRVYNIGAQTPVHFLSFIETLENAIGKTADKQMLPMQRRCTRYVC